MSRSTIGGVVGAVIGYVVSGYNPQGAYWGWVIGSGVGALTDNTKTYGPRLQDGAQQTSQDGTPRTYGYGTFPTTGVILWRDKRKEQEHEQGKGGPSNVSYTYTWSYAIGVCKGPIKNFLIIKRNGTIVYDTRTDQELYDIGYDNEEITKTRMAQQKWLQNATLYYGGDSQMPDPTMQAVNGVNNVPAYRGYAYIVLNNEDVTNDGGAIPQYEFVISECGSTSIARPAELLVTGTAITPGGPMWASKVVGSVFSFAGLPQASGANLPRATPGWFNGLWAAVGDHDARMSRDKRQTWETIANTHADGAMLAAGPKGWLTAISSGPAGSYDKTAKATQLEDGFASYTFETEVREHGEETSMCRYAGRWYWVDGGAQGELSRSKTLTDPVWETVYTRGSENINAFAAFWDIEVDPSNEDIVYACGQWGTGSGAGPIRAQVRKSTNGGSSFTELLIDRAIGDADAPLQLQFGGDVLVVLCRGDSYTFSSVDDFSESHPTGIAGDRTSNPPKYAHQGIGRHIAFGADGLFYCISGKSTTAPELGNKCVRTADGIFFSAAAEMPIQDLYGIASADKYDTSGWYPISDSPGSFVNRDGQIVAPPGQQTARCKPVLSSIVSDQAAKREITRIIVDELTDTYVDGFRVATQTSPLANIQSLMSAYSFDGSEHDGKLWFLMRDRRPLTFTITADDLVEQTGDPFEWEVTKENDLLRKVTVNYFDPLTNYAQTSQDWEMRSSTVKALAEGTFEMALTGTKDWAKQGAEKSGRIAWSERRETKFKVPLWHASRYTGEWGELIDTKGGRHIVRITNINDDGLTREITVRKTRSSAYKSLAEGVSSPLPTFPTTGVKGPAISAIMNMPVLRPEDDEAGVYWASTGLLPDWDGAALSLARTAGTWETGPTMQQPCTMGWLRATLPAASRYVRDNTNVLEVELYPYCPKTLESTDDAGLWMEKNAAALVYPDGKVEMIQFKTSTLVGTNRYALTGLVRGCKDTNPGEHLADAVFVLLDNAIRFVAISPDDVGKTLTFRATSLGTDPDAADEDTLTFNTIESLREWQPYNVVVTPGFSEDPEEEAGAGFCIEWIGRPRLGTSRTPVHSQWFAGYEVKFTVDMLAYTAITLAESLCVSYDTLAESLGPSFGWPTVTVRALSRVATNDDDFDSEPADPVTPEVPDTSGGGAPASPGLGPNGGFPDDTPYWIPEPEVLGTDVIGTDGEFNDASALTAWRTRLGALLGADWEIVDGRAQHTGRVGEAYGYKWRQSLPSQPFDRFSVEVEGSLQTALGKTAQIGIAWGVNTNPAAGAEAPNYLELSDATNYAEETTASHTWLRASQTASMSPYGFYTHVNFMPYVRFVDEYERISIGSIDDVRMVITPVSVALSSAALDHIAFDSGLTGWTVWPDPTLADPDWPDLTTSAGTITMESHHATKTFRNAYCDDPIDLADAAGKYVKVVAEVTCDDPSVDARGITTGGAHIFLASKTTSNGYALNGLYVAQRGDKTQRTWWWRVQGAPGGDLLGWHVCIQMRAADGYMVKVKIISVEVTDDPQD